jgi:hypothetical protein
MVVVVEAWCLKFGFAIGSWLEEVEERDGLKKVLSDSRPRRKKNRLI